MRTFPIAITIGLLIAAPTLALAQSAKMTGQDQNATGPVVHRAQSAKMHAKTDTGSTGKRQSVLRGRAER
jgi:hypothetical protein